MHDPPRRFVDDDFTKARKQAQFERALKWQLLGVGMFLLGLVAMFFGVGPVRWGARSMFGVVGMAMMLASFPIIVFGGWRMPYGRYWIRFGRFQTQVTNRKFDRGSD